MDGAAQTTMKDGTVITFLVKSAFFSSQERIAIQRPGMPPIVLAIGNESEEAAVELLNGAHRALEKEDELAEARKELDEGIAQLKGMIDEAATQYGL